jgi:hypothetical protein
MNEMMTNFLFLYTSHLNWKNIIKNHFLVFFQTNVSFKVINNIFIFHSFKAVSILMKKSLVIDSIINHFFKFGL